MTPLTTLVPLLAVLLVSAVKDIVDDFVSWNELSLESSQVKKIVIFLTHEMTFKIVLISKPIQHFEFLWNFFEHEEKNTSLFYFKLGKP